MAGTSTPIEVHAHRGGAGLAPENTLAAFRKALELGVDVLEMDMHVTHDGQVVIIHDDAIDRTTDGKGLVKDFTLEVLRQRDAGGRFGPQFKGEPIPTLREVIDLVKAAGNDRIRLNIETKFHSDYPGKPEDFEERVLAILRDTGIVERVIVQSFHHPSIAKIKVLESKIKTALLAGGRQAPGDPVSLVRQYKADYYSPNYRHLTAEAVTALHQAGVPVVPWTVNETVDMQRLISMGVGRMPGDGIITNFPDRLLQLLKGSR